ALERHGERRAAVGPVRTEIDPAAVLLHDPVGDRKTEAGAVPRVLRREERIEDAVSRARGDPGAVVLDLDADFGLGREGAQEEPARSARRGDRLLGVVDEVDE